MTLSIVLTIALIAYLLMVIVDYSRTTYTIKKLLQDDTLSKKIKEYDTEIYVIHTQIEGIELEIKDLQKDGKSHTHKIKKLQKKIEKLNEKSSQIKGAKDSLNDLAKDMKKNTKFSVNRLRQIRHDLKKYLYNSQR